MSGDVVVLEDNEERIEVMRECLEARLGRFRCCVFRTPAETIAYLRDNLSGAIAVALDHDMELMENEDGGLTDPGTGREVADYLSDHDPVCPVLLHTTNLPAAEGMRLVLSDAGWQVSQVVPYGGTEWIREAWIVELERLVSGIV